MRNKYIFGVVASCLSLGLFACSTEVTDDDGLGGSAGAPSGTGGHSSTGGASPEGGEGGQGGAPVELSCAHGLALVMTDYFSTEVALLGLDGQVENPSFLSTASTATDGLAFPLSGDVVVPAGITGELVLLDRYGTNVVSFVNAKTGKVRAQLPVGMGFESNPQDYLQLSKSEGTLVRYGQNMNSGQEKFDEGGDMLFIDSASAKITGSLVFENYDELPPSPSAISRVGDALYVTLDRLAADYSEMGDALLVPVSLATRKAGTPIPLTGLKSCGGLVPVPGKDELAIACAGRSLATGEVEALSQSAIVFFDAKAEPLRELRRISAKKIAGEPVQSQIAFASETVALVKTQTAYGGTTNNRLLALNLETEKAEELAEAEPDMSGAGRGVSFGTIYCESACGDVCVMPDASRTELVRASISGGKVKLLDAVQIEGGAGLPPSSLGSF